MKLGMKDIKYIRDHKRFIDGKINPNGMTAKELSEKFDVSAGYIYLVWGKYRRNIDWK